MGQTLEVPQNSDFDWEIDLDDASGAAVTSFTDGDTLSAVVWPGGGAAAAFEPSVGWIDSATGKIKLTVSAAQTSSLAPGTYALQVWVIASGLRRMGFDGALSITKTVGTTTSTARVYTTFDRMRTYAPWLQLVHDSNADQAGFAGQIEEASRWLEGLATRHYRGNMSGTMPTDYSLDHLFWGLRRSLLPPSDLAGWLSAGGLMTSLGGMDLGVEEVVAKYAIGLVCQGRIGPTGGSQYASVAASYLSAAENKAKTLTLAVDTNADGKPDIWIDLGSTDTIYA